MTFVTSPRAVFQKEEAKQAKEVTDGFISQEMKMTMMIPDDFSNNKSRLFVFKVILTALQPAYSAFFLSSSFPISDLEESCKIRNVKQFTKPRKKRHISECVYGLFPLRKQNAEFESNSVNWEIITSAASFSGRYFYVLWKLGGAPKTTTSTLQNAKPKLDAHIN